jgi:hypothetical protein
MIKLKPFTGKQPYQGLGANGDYKTNTFLVVILGNFPASIGVNGKIEFKIIGDQIESYPGVVYKTGVFSFVFKVAYIAIGFNPPPNVGAGIGGHDPIIGKRIIKF